MAAIRTEKINGVNGEWDAPVYLYQLEGQEENTEVIGYSGMDEDNNNPNDPWGVYTAEDGDGQKRYIAVPEAVADEIGLGNEGMTPKKVWRKFLSFGDDWSRMAPPTLKNLPPDRGRFDLVTEMKVIALSGKKTTIGVHPLSKGDELMGTGSLSTAGPVLASYEMFKERILDTVRKNAVCYVDKVRGEFCREGDGDVSELEYKIEFNNLRLEEIDARAEWDAPWNSESRTKKDLTHTLYGDIVILKKTTDGKETVWTPVQKKEDAKLADIPAMHMRNGLFKHNGHEYAINNVLMPEYGNHRIKTAGMKLQEALEIGIWDFCSAMANNIRTSDFSKEEKVFKNADMNSGFDELFLAAKSAEKDEEDLEDVFAEIDDVADKNAKEEEDSKAKKKKDKSKDGSASGKKKKDEDEDKVSKKLYTQPPRPAYNLKGSTQYAKNHNPIPRDALTVVIKNLGDYYTPVYDKKSGNLINIAQTKEEQNVYFENNLFLDGAATPEGRKAVSVGRLIPYVKVDFEGRIFLPCFTPDQLKNLDAIKNLDKDVKWVPAFDEPGTIGGDVLANKVYVRAGQVHADGTFALDKNGKLLAQRGSHTVYVTPDQVDYIAIDPKCDHTAGGEISGLGNNAQDSRKMINNNNVKETSQDPTTAAPSIVGHGDLGVGQYLISRAKDDGVILEIKEDINPFGEKSPSEMVVEYDSGEVETISLGYQQKQNSTYLKSVSPSFNGEERRPLQAGDRIEKNQVLTDTNGMVCGQAVVGRPAVVVIIPGLGVDGTDDSVVLSKDFADDCGHAKVEQQTEQIIVNEEGSPYGFDMFYNPIIGSDSTIFGGFDCSKLGPDGIIRDGEIVSNGDILAWRIVPDGKKARTQGEQIAMDRPVPGEKFTMPEGYKMAPIICNRKVSGAVVHTRVEDASHGRKFMTFETYEKDSAISGFKGSIGGVKGTVKVMSEGKNCKILSCGTAESKFDGVNADIIMTGLSFQNRKTPGPYIDGLITRYAIEEGVVIDRGVDSEKRLENIMDEYQKAGWGDGTVLISGWVSEDVYIPPEKPVRAFMFVTDDYMDVAKDPRENESNKAKSLNPTVEFALLANGLDETNKEIYGTGKGVGSITKSNEQSTLNKLGYGVHISTGAKNKNSNAGRER